MFPIYEGKPLSAIEVHPEPTTFEGGKSVYYRGEGDEILNTTIVAGYWSNAMFSEGRYGITDTGEEIYYPMEMVDWNFKLVSEYLTEKYPELFKCSEMWYPKLSTNSEDCLITRVPPNQEFETIAVGSEDEIRISKDRFIKYGALRVEHLDELAKEVELAMKSKEKSKDENNANWDFASVVRYLTEKFPKLFTLEGNVLKANILDPDNDVENITICVTWSDDIKLLKDKSIKYKDLKVEQLNELAKDVEIAMGPKAECFIRSESTPTDKQLNKYYVRFHYIDDNGKENKFNLLVHWDANSLLKLEIDLREYFKIEQRLFMEIDSINLVEIAGK